MLHVCMHAWESTWAPVGRSIQTPASPVFNEPCVLGCPSQDFIFVVFLWVLKNIQGCTASCAEKLSPMERFQVCLPMAIYPSSGHCLPFECARPANERTAAQRWPVGGSSLILSAAETPALGGPTQKTWKAPSPTGMHSRWHPALAPIND